MTASELYCKRALSSLAVELAGMNKVRTAHGLWLRAFSEIIDIFNLKEAAAAQCHSVNVELQLLLFVLVRICSDDGSLNSSTHDTGFRYDPVPPPESVSVPAGRHRVLPNALLYPRPP